MNTDDNSGLIWVGPSTLGEGYKRLEVGDKDLRVTFEGTDPAPQIGHILYAKSKYDFTDDVVAKMKVVLAK